MLAFGPARRLLMSFVATTLTLGVCVATPAWADPFFFSTGTPDGLLGALSQPAGTGSLETEAADDFILTATTTIAEATISGLIPSGTPLTDISNVEVEIYHVFPGDSADPPSGKVPTRVNSPGDVEIDGATRDASQGTLAFSATLSDESFSVLNTVVDGINPAPENMTNGDGPASGEVVEIRITFTPPIVLPADHYFFRPEVEVAGGDFFYLSAPRPIVTPGTPFAGDLQAWIRNSDLKPDWLRIGTDIIGGATPPTFSMTFSLTGDADAQDETPTATATPSPTATVTGPPSNDGGDGCNLSGPPSAGSLWLLLTSAAVLWWMSRRRVKHCDSARTHRSLMQPARSNWRSSRSSPRASRAR
jgi:hypothetical protein